jgi:hypothetical protein
MHCAGDRAGACHPCIVLGTKLVLGSQLTGSALHACYFPLQLCCVSWQITSDLVRDTEQKGLCVLTDIFGGDIFTDDDARVLHL